ncbi:protein argonaute 2-like [Telopea speciosissima]|uniref:protein argonaute 2-like n=1 Tax=Telopea speciosissima TaxID=54955 RepID=UPI001CC673C8|nr:protein argonaute 2-like [Telopea speciosissima]
MDNNGRGRGRARGGGKNPGSGGGGRGREQNRPVSGQDRSFRQGPTSYQGKSSEPRSPISGHDRGLKEGPSSSQGQFVEPTRPASAWVSSAWGSGKGAWKTSYLPGVSKSPGSASCSGFMDGRHESSESSRTVNVRERLTTVQMEYSKRPHGRHHDPPLSELRSLELSCPLPSSSPPESKNIIPVRRPDNGGTSCVRKGMVRLLVNHFPIKFNPHMVMHQYNIDVEPEMQSKHGGPSQVSNSEIRLMKNKMFSDDTQFPPSMIAYDGGKIIVSAVELPTVKSKVDLPKGRAVKSYMFSTELVKKLELGKLMAYLNGTLPVIPREILQGMDLVMKEKPKKHCIQIGQSFYFMNWDDDLGCGVIACRGFQLSLKLTSQGPALCVDYSVLPFRKPVPVLDYLFERVAGFHTDGIDNQLRNYVENELKGSLVTVNYRETKQRFTIKGLTVPTANDLSFTLEDRDGINPPQEITVVDYFKRTYNKEIEFKNLPCLDLGKSGNVPMEFCKLIEGQIYPKDQLDDDSAAKLRAMSLPKPWDRKNFIHEMVEARDGPLGGETVQNFEIEASTKMTPVTGRVIRAPDLKLGDSDGKACKFTHTREDCQWNLVGRTVLEGKDIERWAVLDFTSYDRRRSLNYDKFVQQLTIRCSKLGICMKAPLFHALSDMSVLSDTGRLRKLLNRVYEKAKRRLQILVCPIIGKHSGDKAALKWICETQIGIVTQLCLSNRCNMGEEHYMTNLALQINTKLGGSNFELFDRLPRLESDDHVMFIGADVNHSRAGNTSSPSAAAVVATVNWPAANKYIGRYRLQKHRTEKILDFGEMCLELINKYAELNKVKPKKIIVFRDGVSDSQFDMVLNEELMDIKKAIQCDGYSPTITLVIAQKRHSTRLFPMDKKQGAYNGNVFPGTVVDTTIVHPWKFDFYLCSHYGMLGTSKPTHYYCLWDDHKFSSDELQQITYNLCYTYARCTKPVSLVPPAYYADNLAYRVQQYYEAWEADAAVSSSSSSYLSQQIDPNIFERHNNLENVMFFC